MNRHITEENMQMAKIKMFSVINHLGIQIKPQ